MNCSDDNLMAYADGELDAAQRADIERALAEDSALRQRVAVMQAQRDRVQAAFSAVLDEPVPDRLSRLLHPPAAVTLDTVRAARHRDTPQPQRPRSPLSWAYWGGMAASLLLGLLLGLQVDRGGTHFGSGLRDGRLVAGDALAQALTSQLASAPVTGAPVTVHLSFVDRAGNYCRTFSTAALAGLSCRQAGQWTLQTVIAVEAAPAGAVRTAASALPTAVLDAVDQRLGGDILDATRERQARDQGWRR